MDYEFSALHGGSAFPLAYWLAGAVAVAQPKASRKTKAYRSRNSKEPCYFNTKRATFRKKSADSRGISHSENQLSTGPIVK